MTPASAGCMEREIMNLAKISSALFLAAMCAAANAGTEELFRGAVWIEAPAGMDAAAPRFTTTFKVDKDGPAKIVVVGAERDA